jgi:predicted HTH domain antitoxin
MKQDPAVAHYLDREYELDLRELRREFGRVERGDPASLRAWFAAHPYLAANDHARVAGVSLRTVRRWQQAAGLPPARRRAPRHRRPPEPAPPPAPPDWRAGTWLADQYPRHSVRQIARAIGRSYPATRRLLLRRGVALRAPKEAVRSRHPCCTPGWLFEHYEARASSLTRCALLAGVSRSTMTAWLLRHRIRIRSNPEQQTLHEDRNPRQGK